MRLDLFLKISVVKRRTVAQKLLKGQRVLVNGRPAKASYEVKDGDIVEVLLPAKKITLRVVGNGGYEILSEERVSKPF
ncbi:MAG: RNA-binding S4 domain protein [Thermotoga petrophila]|jgi:ribosomal 50S subunit-recycling heat shock protein|uniref:RNA-binding S4 domain protein n=1 Tax=Thermotoga petrophila TaxID=93929 RepID=A0A101EPU1_9THEM|nr:MULTISPECIES: S4 domain-containing protein [unclassified Thermotoga]KAF2959399.1 RNA-binding protein [Thermotoga sp. 38H-to]KHC93305.1 RNA-binding S4 domain protein [Thermotoga sp. Mc24]KUK22707.1 MAG: RNA-binding S4 domain protein [Thermotoga petrophila]HAA81826.1 RNA-binding protein [Thermotoga petrophila]